ncbi:MAG: GH3 auxin-responsive promoter family protein [Phycisphaerales bacterium]
MAAIVEQPAPAVATAHAPPRAVPPRNRWTSLIGSAIHLRLARRIRKLNNTAYWQRHTAAIQRRQLRSLLSRAANTEFGREHAFARLARLSDADILPAYRAAAPIRDWYAFKDRIARMREGAEPDVLWPGIVRDYAQTSGTTAGDKYIPVTREMLRSNYRASMDLLSHAARFGVPPRRIFGGRILFLGGSTDLATSDRGIRTGDLSGIVTPLIRWPITEVYSPGRDIALMSHWPAKIEAMARSCLDQDIRMVSGMPSWAIVLFERVIALAREKGRPARTLRDVWPNLSIFVHGGVKYAPFDPKVRTLWSGSPTGDDLPARLELYPASEGFIAIQDRHRDPGLRLLTDIGNVLEFVPLESIDDAGAPAFAADEAEKGQRYVVVLSTCAGLWRYVLGDVVEFDTVPSRLDGRGGDGPARVRIVGRHRHFINAFGENLIVEHVENAVAKAAAAAGLMVGEFTAAPVYPGEGRRAGLELAIEVEAKAVPSGSLRTFTEEFDQALKAQNVDYTTKRTDSLGMAPPTVTPLPLGAFHRWLASKGKVGGQHKCPRCANAREIIEAVIAASGVRSPGEGNGKPGAPNQLQA